MLATVDVHGSKGEAPRGMPPGSNGGEGQGKEYVPRSPLWWLVGVRVECLVGGLGWTGCRWGAKG